MKDEIRRTDYPPHYSELLQATTELGFTMASDAQTCSLLRTLVASKPAGKMLELGTGTGLATAWLLDGLSGGASMTTIDNDPNCIDIARKFLAHHQQLEIVLSDGAAWIEQNLSNRYDFIFAD